MHSKKEYIKELTLEKKLVLFTSNFQGGIIQFTMHLATVLSKLNFDVIVFIPNNAKNIEQKNNAITICEYNRHKNLRTNNRFSSETTKAIKAFQPDLVLFCDNEIISLQTLLAIKKECRTSMYIHDVTPHPTRFSVYDAIKHVQKEKLLRKALKATNQIILLSENSFGLFNSLYPSYNYKAVWMPLGAHVPDVEPQKPVEFGNTINSGYYLFFGRIDKYKGIINLLKAYTLIVDEEKPILVIAGGGELQIEEKAIIDSDEGIFLINRFIQDGEMLYLMQNSKSVILPYIEASQSGVIPIAYYYSIPVITSNVSGLVEFVENGISGIICSNNKEMKEALLKIKDNTFREKLSKGAYNYHKDRLNWDVNVKRCIDLVLTENIKE